MAAWAAVRTGLQQLDSGEVEADDGRCSGAGADEEEHHAAHENGHVQHHLHLVQAPPPMYHEQQRRDHEPDDGHEHGAEEGGVEGKIGRDNGNDAGEGNLEAPADESFALAPSNVAGGGQEEVLNDLGGRIEGYGVGEEEGSGEGELEASREPGVWQAVGDDCALAKANEVGEGGEGGVEEDHQHSAAGDHRHTVGGLAQRCLDGDDEVDALDAVDCAAHHYGQGCPADEEGLQVDEHPHLAQQADVGEEHQQRHGQQHGHRLVQRRHDGVERAGHHQQDAAAEGPLKQH
eukprot:CAMPEP_0114632758 /NCGR_PEP_ID=MMETSP0168-20121206/15098_1 /TAXON_ID=95228 ORGANISM="Vannella sp., Strain DIVA3 517/6/12" /NCGR_SAMPLE_ID=MMETSP0168 /ASSEMBLY_ACC=CAM_ASM_000044 /LENGTH=289 /DNA_ID=CAMNT_0001844375 /DNA_START=33 /DNA_END=900 /DNA_ORIENTATION=-